MKELFEKMDTYMEIYRQYTEHYKSIFPYVPARNFNEWATNVGMNNEEGLGCEALLCPLSKIGKKCLDCGHLLLKFII